MNKQELDNSLQYFSDNEDTIGITIYALIKQEENVKKLDISASSLPDLKSIFLNSITNCIIAPEELSVLPLSTSDDRKNVIYEYDIEIPNDLLKLEQVTQTDDTEIFNVTTDNISSIKALIIEIGDNNNQVVIYKSMAPINIYGLSSFFLKKSAHRFDKITEEFLRITPNFQIIRTGGSIFVLDLKTIEKMFGFHEAITRQATLGIEAIKDFGILENPEALVEMVEDIRFARKLTKVAHDSPVIKSKVTNDSIIEFCKTFPNLKGKIRFNQDEDKILLDTKVSKNLLVQLLMDNFLTSKLTHFHYTSIAKDTAIEGKDKNINE